MKEESSRIERKQMGEDKKRWKPLSRFSLLIDRFEPFCYHLIKIDNIGGIYGQDTNTTDRGSGEGA